MAIKTQRCPFCGCDEKDLTIASESVLGRSRYFVLCENCSSQGPNERSEGEAWERWNDRF